MSFMCVHPYFGWGNRRGRSASAYQVSTAVSSHLSLSAYLHEQTMRTLAVWGDFHGHGSRGSGWTAR